MNQLIKQDDVVGFPPISFLDGVCPIIILVGTLKRDLRKERLIEPHHFLILCPVTLLVPFLTYLWINKYTYLLLNFIDYISIYTGVYFLKHKADVFSFLRYFKALAEKQSGKGINILHTDNGRDYSNKYVNNLYPFHLQFFTWQLLRHISMVCFSISFSF